MRCAARLFRLNGRAEQDFLRRRRVSRLFFAAACDACGACSGHCVGMRAGRAPGLTFGTAVGSLPLLLLHTTAHLLPPASCHPLHFYLPAPLHYLHYFCHYWTQDLRRFYGKNVCRRYYYCNGCPVAPRRTRRCHCRRYRTVSDCRLPLGVAALAYRAWLHTAPPPRLAERAATAAARISRRNAGDALPPPARRQRHAWLRLNRAVQPLLTTVWLPSPMAHGDCCCSLLILPGVLWRGGRPSARDAYVRHLL